MLRALALLATIAGALLAAGAASADTSLSIQKLQRIGTGNAYMPGTVIGRLGDTVDYQIIVQNDGAEAVSVNLADTGCSGLLPAGPQTVQPGGGYVAFACSHVLSAADGGSWTNIASLTGTTASGATISLAPVNTVAVVAVTGNLAGANVTIRHKVRHKHHARHPRLA